MKGRVTTCVGTGPGQHWGPRAPEPLKTFPHLTRWVGTTSSYPRFRCLHEFQDKSQGVSQKRNWFRHTANDTVNDRTRDPEREYSIVMKKIRRVRSLVLWDIIGQTPPRPTPVQTRTHDPTLPPYTTPWFSMETNYSIKRFNLVVRRINRIRTTER